MPNTSTSSPESIKKILQSIMGVEEHQLQSHFMNMKEGGHVIASPVVRAWDEQTEKNIGKRLEEAGMKKNEDFMVEKKATPGTNESHLHYDFLLPGNSEEAAAKLHAHALQGTATRLTKAHREAEKEIAAVSTPSTLPTNTRKVWQTVGKSGVDLENLASHVNAMTAQR